jgi:hypothetical protein
MRLVSANVGPIKSIEKPIDVKIEERVTVLVGMNESGKTVFLQALQKSDDVFGTAKFDPVDDYPRKDLNTYERRHADNPDAVTELTFALSKEEIAKANEQFYLQLPEQFNCTVTHRYDNLSFVSCKVDEKPVLLELAKQVDLSAEYRAALQGTGKISLIPKAVEGLSLTDADKESLALVNQRIEAADKGKWPQDVVGYELWLWLSRRTPKFMYFGDYEVLPSKMNLPDLARRVAEEKSKPQELTSEHRGILACSAWQTYSLCKRLLDGQSHKTFSSRKGIYWSKDRRTLFTCKQFHPS